MEQALLTTRLYVAGILGRFDLFPPTRELLERQVAEAGGFVEFTEQLTYAEALLLHENPAERDVVRAQELVDDYLERSGLRPGEWPAEWDPTMQNISRRIEEGRLARQE